MKDVAEGAGDFKNQVRSVPFIVFSTKFVANV